MGANDEFDVKVKKVLANSSKTNFRTQMAITNCNYIIEDLNLQIFV